MDNNLNTWNIIRNYFENKGLISHQLSSFNEFINNGIDKIFTEEPDIVFSQKKGHEYRIKFLRTYIPNPSVTEDDRTITNVLPYFARQRDLNYESPVYVDISETLKEDDKIEEKIHNRVCIAKIPIMLGSSKCNLYNMTKKNRISAGECEYDNGGYFIIRGKERVLVGQIRGNHNQIIVLKQKPPSKYSYTADIRSMSEETGHSVLIQAMISIEGKCTYFSIPYIQQHIKAGILFKAMGYTTDEEIISLIGLQGPKIQRYLNVITRDSYFIQTQDEALEYIGQYVMHVVPKEKKKVYAWQIVETEIFPHMGVSASIREKALFLGHIVNKIISTDVGFRAEDDRDNYCNKRVEVSGILFHDLFRTLFKRFTKIVLQQLIKRQQRPDGLSIIIRNTSITNGFRNCMGTGNWGIIKNNSYVRAGVSQILSRLTFAAGISHLRRIVIPIGKEGKNTKIRQIHSSQFGLVCSSETPEGATAGIVLNLALMTQVTSRIPTIIVKEVLERISYPNGSLIISLNNVETVFDITKVFLNGIFFGTTNQPEDLIIELKRLRNIGSLSKEISISYDSIEEEIKIFSDEGRLVRPLLKIQDGVLRLQKSDGCDWDYLVRNGIIDYLDSSEIESQVIAMTQKHIENGIYDYCEIHPSTILGVCASDIPFPANNKSPRNCYSSSMRKQAIGVFALSHKIRTDTIVHVLDYVQSPLVRTKASTFLNFDKMPSGINCIVAVACYGGWNQEDSVMLNKSAVERGLFRSTSYRTLVDEEKKRGTYNSETIELPSIELHTKGYNYNFLDTDGIIQVGVRVSKGDVIIGKTINKSSKNGEEEKTDCSVIIKSGEEGIVDRVIVSQTPNGYKLVKVVIRNSKIPEVGDKFASRAGQKGTCGMIFPQVDMPFSEQTGITPDIIINPHCLPSRMTMNQLMETVLGKACVMEGQYGDSTPFENNDDGNLVNTFCSRLKSVGFEQHGWERLINGMTGDVIKAKIFMGPTYYQRLKHMVSEKQHSRSSGSVTMLTRQPLEGRSREGGLRFGEMERDCMIAHGVSAFLKERLFEMSDPYQVIICNKCGIIVPSKTECKGCGEDLVTKVNLPYASKLLIQELQSMSIKIALKPKI